LGPAVGRHGGGELEEELAAVPPGVFRLEHAPFEIDHRALIGEILSFAINRLETSA